MLEPSGLKVAVLLASVDTAGCEDWIFNQVDRAGGVLITTVDLVKTGLDLPDLPTIIVLQTGYNIYTLQQAARRLYRIYHKQVVRLLFFGYTSTTACCLPP